MQNSPNSFFKISLPQKKLVLQAPSGVNLMLFLHENEIPVASSCLGDGICSMCKMKIKGPVAKPEQLEINTLKRNKCSEQERLSCQIQIESDLEVTTTYW